MGVCTVVDQPYGTIPQNLGQIYWTGPWQITLSSSYATGGDTITPRQVGLGSSIQSVIISTNQASQATMYLLVYNSNNGTIQAFESAAVAATPAAAAPFAEVANGTNLSAVTFGAVVVGI